MQKQQASNTFSKGLNLDLSPIATPNDILTGALNASFITYNGNEFMLQNDMGNGRVESAALPEGYIPVGIKEYGGIVYVASYNPLTNKGQIGSFPSPERNINSDETGETIKSIQFKDFFDNNSGNLISTTCKIVITDKFILNPGDNFGISLQGEGFEYLSNYFNTTEDKVESPKNNVLTLKIIVEDNNGNLKDITSKLKRVDKQGKEIKSSINSIFIKNSGYFLYTEPLDINDSEKAINVFSEKNSGKLYLVASLNIIQKILLDSTVNINILGNKKFLNVKHKVKQLYNCPDGLNSDNETNATINTVYNSIHKQPKNLIDKNLNIIEEPLIQAKIKNEVIEELVKLEKEGFDTCTYDNNNNVYIKESTYKGSLEITNLNLNDYIYTIGVAPKMSYQKKGDFLFNLKVVNDFYLNKINSNTVDLTLWKYYINNNKLILDWGIVSYLNEDLSINKITINFSDVKSSINNNIFISKYTYVNTNITGTSNNVLTLDLTDPNKLLPNKLYLAVITIYYTDSEGITKKINNYRWLFTTSLYNNYYLTTKDFKSLIKDNIIENDLQLISNIENIDINNVDNQFSTINENLDKINLSLEASQEQKTTLNGTFTINTYLKNSNLYPFIYNKEGIISTFEKDPFTIPQVEIKRFEDIEKVPQPKVSNYLDLNIKNNTFILKDVLINRYLYSKCLKSKIIRNKFERYINNPYEINNHFKEIFGVEANGDDNSPYLRNLLKIGTKSKTNNKGISYIEIDEFSRSKDNINGNYLKQLFLKKSEKGGYLEVKLNSNDINNIISQMSIKAPIIFIGGCTGHLQDSNYILERPDFDMTDPEDREAALRFDANFNVYSNDYFKGGVYDTYLSVGEPESNASNKYVYYLMFWYDGTKYVLNKKIFYDITNRHRGKSVEMPVNFYGQFKDYFIYRNLNDINYVYKIDQNNCSYETNTNIEITYVIKNYLNNISESNFENINTCIGKTAEYAAEYFKDTNTKVFSDLGISKINNNYNTFFKISTTKINNFNLKIPIVCVSMKSVYETLFTKFYANNVLELNGILYDKDSNNNSLKEDGVYELKNGILYKDPNFYTGLFNNKRTILVNKNLENNLNGEPIRFLSSYNNKNGNVVAVRVKFGGYPFIPKDDIVLNGYRVESTDTTKYYNSNTLENIDLYQ